MKNNHYSHKIIEIEDEESLKKENISIEVSKKQLGELYEKINTVKERIEKEMEEINKIYDKTFSEVTKSYEIKHEKLLKEENELKDKLQTEVTKVKEILENYLSKSNSIIKLNERINKGLNNLEKEEKSMLKILSYVSKMSKYQKDSKMLLSELIPNLKISFIEEETKIKYDEYFFNGIQVPKDIEAYEVNNNSFKLKWKIDDLNIININNDELKFRVELRKENKKERFKSVYEGKELECLIDNLEEKTNYEIKICTIYNDLIGQWSDNCKVQTTDFDSVILRHSKQEKKFLEKIFEWTGFKRMELLYRGTRDGTTSQAFHEKCDHKGPTICLYKNEKGYIFGGYASISWTSDGSTHEAPNSFIFTLTNIYGIEPTKFTSKDSNNVNHHSGRGPCFGNYNDISVYADFSSSNCAVYFPTNYNDNLGKGKSIFTGDFNNNNAEFKMEEIEVFKIY